jgi:hypothetical protein
LIRNSVILKAIPKASISKVVFPWCSLVLFSHSCSNPMCDMCVWISTEAFYMCFI